MPKYHTKFGDKLMNYCIEFGIVWPSKTKVNECSFKKQIMGKDFNH